MRNQNVAVSRPAANPWLSNRLPLRKRKDETAKTPLHVEHPVITSYEVNLSPWDDDNE